MQQIKDNNSLKMNIYRKLKYNLLQRHVYGITSCVRELPDFLVIGANRCGTTSLYEYLGEHPCIKKSSHDHIGFFDDNFQLGINFYKSFFPTIFEKKYFKFKNGKYLINDVTSSYIQNSKTASRIFDTLPKIKIIAILRNPVDRAYSEYNLHLRTNSTIQSFETYVEKELAEINDKSKNIEIEKGKNKDNEKKYLEKGFYFEQLKPWFELFPKEKILILSTEKFGENANDVFNSIFEFLDLKSYSIKNPKRMQKGSYSKLKTVTREKLLDFYKPKNIQLYNLVGKDFHWEK